MEPVVNANCFGRVSFCIYSNFIPIVAGIQKGIVALNGMAHVTFQGLLIGELIC